jgi:hypothetical protein
MPRYEYIGFTEDSICCITVFDKLRLSKTVE